MPDLVRCLEASRARRSTRRSRSSSSTRARRTAAPSVARSAGARVHEIPPAEFGHGRTRNLGASLARARLVVFTSQDAVADDDAGSRRSPRPPARRPRRRRAPTDASCRTPTPGRPSASSSTSSTGPSRACSGSRRASELDLRVDAVLERELPRSRARVLERFPFARRPDDERGPGVVAARPPGGLRARLRAPRGRPPLPRVHRRARPSAGSSTRASPPSTRTSRATSRGPRCGARARATRGRSSRGSGGRAGAAGSRTPSSTSSRSSRGCSSGCATTGSRARSAPRSVVLG